MRLRVGDMFGPDSDSFDEAVEGSGMDRELVIWIDEQNDLVALLHLMRDRYPRLTRLSVIIATVSCAGSILEKSSRIRSHWLDKALTDEDRVSRDRRMEAISPIVANRPDIFDPVARGRLIGQRHRQTGIARNSLKSWVMRYFRHGQCANALLDLYENCGHRRKGVVGENWAKLGRPPRPIFGSAHENVTEVLRREFLDAVERERKQAGESFSVAAAHRRWLNEHCHVIGEVDGHLVATRAAKYAAIDPASYLQFYRWYCDSGQAEATARRILSEPIYEKDNRAIVSSSTVETSGPGSRFQIDATECNFSLVSSLNDRVLVGVPYLYFVRDVWSRYIMGYYMGFQPPSMIAASLALMNAYMSKEPLLREFGFDPTVDRWVGHHVAASLLHDGGELTSHQGDWLVGELSTTFEQTASDRGDLKGAIETLFRWSDVQWSSEVPGKRSSARYRGRRREAEDIDLAAAGKLMSVRAFERKVIAFILFWNNDHVLKGFDADRDMAAAGVNRIAHDIWEWGVTNRGVPRSYDDEFVRFKLMPRADVKIYADGIHFQGLVFSSPCIHPIQAEAARLGRVIPAQISHDLTSERVFWHTKGSPTGYLIVELADRFRSRRFLRLEEVAAEDDARDMRETEAVREEQRVQAENAAVDREDARRRAKKQGGALGVTRAEAKLAKGRARAGERKQEMLDKLRLLSPSEPKQNFPYAAPVSSNVVSFRPQTKRNYAPPSLEDVEDGD